MRKILFILVILLNYFSFSQEKNAMSLLFMGDIMGHEPQITSAYDADTKTYNYDSVFAQILPIIKQNDFGIANLEVTLAGEPYSGYPMFSSPDALVQACKKSGINVMVTANNHSCDRGKKGVVRTLDVLDSLQILHTGTFRNQQEREEKNLLILEKNNIKVGILNYTYGTNGMPIPEPTIVNLLDTITIVSDIAKARNKGLDKLIATVHWGNEYQQSPSKKQEEMANFLFDKGIDIIIGSHPHVLQPMVYYPAQEHKKEQMIVYSLGNFVSNQRKPNTDGGAMVKLVFEKENETTQIAQKGYYLTWVHKYLVGKKYRYEIVSCTQAEQGNYECLNEEDTKKIKLFIANTRKLFQSKNINIEEIVK
ncbi:CapA family protein [Capnocytophaga catalasegens]|uniref:Capsular polysaccharide biosynthesis protein n=1 Tax=Capnocytophaga catalasegens TaxID=1004260 RepID=A0AAV5AXQ2_9FLAO|nr:CapA family protein [Capnocytophaga catalasegens]GIZ16494.1 capsular polysaccharide biosynthesis protein [Capnocytophaga catalasegens]GJM50267.1 capsular polysaccharide biosynthesis protein [Capnocytophaga catalasegens]GJM53784.1 capsular polysaccharide biosynthesis protein [Capnocytophaga catalasegens]